MQSFAKIILGLMILVKASLASALPLGFGRNQGDLNYDQLLSKNFSVYHDHQAPLEARVILEALESARPEVERWMGVKRKNPLNVILSSTTSNPSFANFLVDAIELQTMGRGGRDLAWHEYTHSTMYRHLDNIFGPAGSIVHLPWMPAWWIEGLAETFSISGGSDYQYGIERYFALHGTWPSYDKIHSLYDGSRFSSIGYGISGAFVSYILRTYGTEKLPQLLNNFFDYSMPWWWAWTFVPWNGFMPMDQALKEYSGKTGRELYEEYKSAATVYWKAQNQLTFFQDSAQGLQIGNLPLSMSPGQAPLNPGPGKSMTFASTHQIQSRNNELYFTNRDRGELFEAIVVWDKNRAQDWKKVEDLPNDILNARLSHPQFRITTTADKSGENEASRIVWSWKNGSKKQLFKRSTYISDFFMSEKKLLWFEEKLEWNRLCWVPRSMVETSDSIGSDSIHCNLEARFPKSLRILGQRQNLNSGDTDEIWFSQSEETLFGDRFKIIKWSAHQDSLTEISNSFHGKPISVGFNKDGTWLVLADSTHHFIRQLDASGQCINEINLANIVERILNSSGSHLYVSLWEESGILLARIQPKQLPLTKCQIHDEPSSPLQLSMRSPGKSLQEHLINMRPWSTPSSIELESATKILTEAPQLGLYSTLNGEELKSEPAAWKAKPMFAFPWIGIDALGYQLGTISVPLIDNLQNERVQLSALYGVESRFPNLELNLYSSRWDTTWSAGIFHRQSWNGSFRNRVYYFDEKGIEIGASRYLRSIDTAVRIGYKNAYESPYIGDQDVWAFLAKGYLRELSLGLSRSHVWSKASLRYGLASNLATKHFNGNYDYDQISMNSELFIPMQLFGKNSSQSWGLNYGQVRGTRRKLLKEAYRPLRTFVPGSGGGINEINQTLYGPGALTSAAFGDTQARAQFSWTVPLVEDLARVIHIVYLQRLDFTAFYNYGKAWFQNSGTPDLRSGIRAHGYNIDLQSDIKGVKLNVGLGTGQVVGNPFEVYMLFGFDALIDQT